MKQLFEKLKQQSKVYSREFEKAKEKYMNTNTLGRLKGFKDQLDNKMKNEKEQINRQHFKADYKQGQQRSDSYKTTKPNSKSEWWKMSTYSQEKASQRFKENYKWTQDRLKDFWSGTKDNYSWLLREYYKDYSGRLKSLGRSKIGEFSTAAGANYRKIIQKYSLRRKLKWLLGLGLLFIFLYGLGKELPHAYLKYKLEAEKLELEKKKLKIKELYEKKNEEDEPYRI